MNTEIAIAEFNMHAEKVRVSQGRDQFGRDATTCRPQAADAEVWAASAIDAADALESGGRVAGSIAGARLVKRLREAARSFERIAERDRDYAVEKIVDYRTNDSKRPPLGEVTCCRSCASS